LEGKFLKIVAMLEKGDVIHEYGWVREKFLERGRDKRAVLLRKNERRGVKRGRRGNSGGEPCLLKNS